MKPRPTPSCADPARRAVRRSTSHARVLAVVLASASPAVAAPSELDEPPPPAHHDVAPQARTPWTPRWGLVIAGTATFLGTWAVPCALGVDASYPELCVPIAGPIVVFHRRITEPRTLGLYGEVPDAATYLVLTALPFAQVAGMTLLTFGLVLPPEGANDDGGARPRATFAVSPVVAPGAFGVGAVGTF